MDRRQETILKIVSARWFPDLSVSNFPRIHSGDGAALRNLEEALSVIEELGVGVFSISAQRQDVLELIASARARHPNLVAGVHSLMDTPAALKHAGMQGRYVPFLTGASAAEEAELNRLGTQGLYVPPSPKKAFDAGVRILTSLNGFRRKTYTCKRFSNRGSVGPNAVLIGGGTTPSEWQAEWGKGANFVKFAGAELFPPNYMATYMPSMHHLIPFYVSGHIVRPTWQLDREKIKSALTPYIKNAAGEFVGTFTFGFGYPFNATSREGMLAKGKLLLDVIKEIREQTRATSGLGLHHAIESAGSCEGLAINTGRYFNA